MTVVGWKEGRRERFGGKGLEPNLVYGQKELVMPCCTVLTVPQ